MKLEEQKLKTQTEQNKELIKVAKRVTEAIEKYYTLKLTKLEAPKFKWSTTLFSVIILLIVVGSGLLVYYGKLSSSNFTLLIGVIVGYLMTFIKNVVLVQSEEEFLRLIIIKGVISSSTS